MNIAFSPPDMTEAEVQGAADAIRSGWITTGPKTKELEHKIAEYCQVNRTVCLNSQTACAEMALRLLGIGAENGGSAEDEVIVPAYTYTASASVVCHVGARLVLIDSQKESLEMDYEALENAITENTKAIIPVDLGGVPCDYDRIFSIAEQKKHMFKASNDTENDRKGSNLHRCSPCIRSEMAWQNGGEHRRYVKFLISCCKKSDHR